MATAVTLVLTAEEPALLRVARDLFPEAETLALTRDELRPWVPFGGPLFAALASCAAGSCVGLVCPVRVRPDPGRAPCGTTDPPAGPLLAVSDHVNLALRGPLTGPWPAGVPRTFPPLADIYQPAIVRDRGGARVYSSGVVAGVSDVERLTPFEDVTAHEEGLTAISDSLVPPAIVAAYYGLTLAACGVTRTDHNDEE